MHALSHDSCLLPPISLSVHSTFPSLSRFPHPLPESANPLFIYIYIYIPTHCVTEGKKSVDQQNKPRNSIMSSLSHFLTPPFLPNKLSPAVSVSSSFATSLSTFAPPEFAGAALLHCRKIEGVYAAGEDLPLDYADWLPEQPDPSCRRRAGVLLHPTSFPGPYGIGDLGPQAFRFLDWLHLAGCSLWQVTPALQFFYKY